MSGLRPFIAIPKDLREWTRWASEQPLDPGDDSVTTVKIKDTAVTEAKIKDKAVTYAKIQDVVADRILGRLSTLGVVSELTAAQLVTLLQAEVWTFAAIVGFDSVQIGFFGVAPKVQQVDTGSATITTVSGSGDDATINTNFANLDTAIDGLRATLNNLGLQA